MILPKYKNPRYANISQAIFYIEHTCITINVWLLALVNLLDFHKKKVLRSILASRYCFRMNWMHIKKGILVLSFVRSSVTKISMKFVNEKLFREKSTVNFVER